MYRSPWAALIASVTIAVIPLAGVFAALLPAAPAEALAPAISAYDDEVIVITAAGQLRVDDPFTPPGYYPVIWNSGAETGFTVVAGGDFNGDGDAELVAARGSQVRVFDPLVQPGRPAVSFTVGLGSGYNVRLLNTGDFDADGKDEFAVMHYMPGSGVPAGLKIYDGGANATEKPIAIAFTPSPTSIVERWR